MFNQDSDCIMIDAHVHLHDADHAMQDLQMAFDNFNSMPVQAHTAVIMLAERQGHDVFRHLTPKLEQTAEPISLWYGHHSRHMLVINGRQIISAEGLEVLGLATATQLPDGLPINEILDHLLDQDALVVLPWGVGKWLGKRGKLIDSLLTGTQKDRIFLGDNGGRPSFWPVPQFNEGFSVLPGSDPLPLPGSARNIGSFGTLLPAKLSRQTPAAEIKGLLRSRHLPLQSFGKPASTLGFIRDQAMLRLKKLRLKKNKELIPA